MSLPDQSLVGRTVVLVKYAPSPNPDLVVLRAEPHRLPLEGGGMVAGALYELHFPDGTTGWYHRWEFEPIDIVDC